MTTRRSAALALCLGLVLTACTAEEDREPSPVVEQTTTGGGSTTTTTPTGGSTIASPATTPTTAGPGDVRITVVAGVVSGGGRHRVAKGTTVHLVVQADVTDEVHVHGYDEKAAVAPGREAVIDLVASIPGVFEVELEKTGKELAQLEVR